jgi:hypothetical protein
MKFQFESFMKNRTMPFGEPNSESHVCHVNKKKKFIITSVFKFG